MSLAVKYRPNTFESVCGQKETITILENQIKNGEVKNAYLFIGPAGCGKTTMARILANKINNGQGTPIELDAASHNSVDDVRDIIQQAQTAALDSEYKIFIQDEVQSLSSGAWQAMLKLLEEPPKKSIFIMCTTEAQKVPKTILSRVQRFQFQRISQQEIIERLEYILNAEYEIGNHYEWHNDALDYIAKASRGGMRDSITMLEKVISFSDVISLENTVKALGLADYTTMSILSTALTKSDSRAVTEVISSIYASGKDLKVFIRDYVDYLLDLCKYDVTKSYEFIQIPSTEEIEKKYSADDFWYFRHLLAVCIKLNEQIKWDSTPKSMIEATLLLECFRGKE